MPELIDRAKVLKYLTPRIKTETPYGEGYNRALEDAAELVTLMPTIETEPVRKPEMSEEDRKRCEEWCKDCEHIEMCKWYPFGGFDFRLLPKLEQPTIEAAPVRHGLWMKIEPTISLQSRWKCSRSKCGGIVHAITDYCPYCGARMDAADDQVGGRG